MVLISGAARGIGAQTAQSMALEGAIVFIADILDEQSQKVAREINDHGDKAFALHLDVTDENSWQKVIDSVLESTGQLDVLVNNAGIVLAQNFEEASLQDWQKLVNVNMTSVFLGTKLCAPALRKSGHNSVGGSSIINLSSVLGLVAAPNDPLYSMTKGGVTLFTKSTAVTFANKGDPIRVNSIHPGVIETQMGEQVIAAQAKRLGITDANRVRELTAERHPIGRMGQTKDVANAALFWASDKAAFITGSNLVVDGGYTAQ
ncbi:MAG: 3(or 17)beta-hydroxysteroid dehydrogenase [Saprospiraceae bacterium]